MGFGSPLKTWDEIMPFKRKALDLAINWPQHTAETLGDLVGCLQGLPDDLQQAIWDVVFKWIAAGPADEDKAHLKERIRRFAFTRRAKAQKREEAVLDAAHKALKLLEPTDLVLRHAWLFEKQWVEKSLDDAEDEKFDYRKHEEKVTVSRRAALAEVWEQTGHEGIKKLCQLGEASPSIGWILADGALPASEAEGLVRRLASEEVSAMWADQCLGSFLGRLEAPTCNALLVALISHLRDEGSAGIDQLVRILKAAPFRKPTWDIIEKLPEGIAHRYWKEVYPNWQHQTPAELRELVERLLHVKRPRAAFHTVHFVTEQLDSDVLARLLDAVATSDNEPANQYHLKDYEVEEAFKVLDGRGDVAKQEMATLEFAFLTSLRRSKRGIPNLARELAATPLLFIQVVALVFKRSDGGTDPVEWKLQDQDRSARASHAYHLLDACDRLPGRQDDDSFDGAKLELDCRGAPTMCDARTRRNRGSDDWAIACQESCRIGRYFAS